MHKKNKFWHNQYTIPILVALLIPSFVFIKCNSWIIGVRSASLAKWGIPNGIMKLWADTFLSLYQVCTRLKFLKDAPPQPSINTAPFCSLTRWLTNLLSLKRTFKIFNIKHTHCKNLIVKWEVSVSLSKFRTNERTQSLQELDWRKKWFSNWGCYGWNSRYMQFMCCLEFIKWN